MGQWGPNLGPCGGCCLEPAQEHHETRWSYVGAGNGEYEPAADVYNYVGQGAGTFEPGARPTMEEGSCVRSFSLVLCALLTLGVLGLVVTAARGEAPKFDCETGYANWTTAWTAEQQTWCCNHVHRGCWVVNGTAGSSNTTAPTTPPPQAACDTMCTYTGETYSCTQRILFASTHQVGASSPNSCAAALSIVVKDCPACSACPLAETGCGGAATLVSTALPTEAATLVSADTSTSLLDQDCDTDYLRWRGVWSAERQKYCCEHKGRACPASTTAAPNTTTPNTTTPTTVEVEPLENGTVMRQ